MLSQHPVGAAHPSVHHVWEAGRGGEFGQRSRRGGQHRERDYLHRQHAGRGPWTFLQEALRRWRDHVGEEERRGRPGRVRDEDKSGAARRQRLVLLRGRAVDPGPGSILAEDRTEDAGRWQPDRAATRSVRQCGTSARVCLFAWFVLTCANAITTCSIFQGHGV